MLQIIRCRRVEPLPWVDNDPELNTVVVCALLLNLSIW